MIIKEKGHEGFRSRKMKPCTPIKNILSQFVLSRRTRKLSWANLPWNAFRFIHNGKSLFPEDLTTKTLEQLGMSDGLETLQAEIVLDESYPRYSIEVRQRVSRCHDGRILEGEGLRGEREIGETYFGTIIDYSLEMDAYVVDLDDGGREFLDYVVEALSHYANNCNNDFQCIIGITKTRTCELRTMNLKTGTVVNETCNKVHFLNAEFDYFLMKNIDNILVETVIDFWVEWHEEYELSSSDANVIFAHSILSVRQHLGHNISLVKAYFWVSLIAADPERFLNLLEFKSEFMDGLLGCYPIMKRERDLLSFESLEPDSD